MKGIISLIETTHRSSTTLKEATLNWKKRVGMAEEAMIEIQVLILVLGDHTDFII